MPARVTIGDVAGACRVSVATVSKVINDRYGVADDDLRRVKAVIDELGYESSLVARSLRSQAHERDRRARRRHRAVQRRAAQGRRRGRSRARATSSIVYSGSGHGNPTRPAGSAATSRRLSGTLADGIILVTPTVVDRRPARRSSPSTTTSGSSEPAHRPFRQPRSARSPPPSTSSASAIGASASSPADPTSSRRGCGSRVPRRLEQAGIAFDPTLVRVGGYELETAREPARRAAGARRCADGDLRGQRPDRRSR